MVCVCICAPATCTSGMSKPICTFQCWRVYASIKMMTFSRKAFTYFNMTMENWILHLIQQHGFVVKENFHQLKTSGASWFRKYGKEVSGLLSRYNPKGQTTCLLSCQMFMYCCYKREYHEINFHEIMKSLSLQIWFFFCYIIPRSFPIVLFNTAQYPR